MESLPSPGAGDARRTDILRSDGILLLPLLIGAPLAWMIASQALGDPFPCGIDDVQLACPPALIEVRLTTLLMLLVVVPLVLCIATIAAVAVLAGRRKRSWPAAATGVALVALSGAGGIVFWLVMNQ